MAAGAMRLLLAAFACVYGLVIAVRNRLYDWRVLKKAVLPVPVVCVGNITAGGTGKTPMVVWLCRYLQSLGLKVVVLSRGYKSHGNDSNDEMRLLADSLPDVEMVVDSNRFGGGQSAIEKYRPDVIVMDDGFQHRQMLPRGLLREPVKELGRAKIVVLSRADAVSDDKLAEIKNQIGNVCDGIIAVSRHKPTGLYNASGDTIAIEELRGKKLFAFCAIGNPDAFLATLEKSGSKLVGKRFFQDHATYDENKLSQLQKTAHECQADWVVTTQKDWVKLKEVLEATVVTRGSTCRDRARARREGAPTKNGGHGPPYEWRAKPQPTLMEQLYWVKVEMEIVEGKDKVCGLINGVISL